MCSFAAISYSTSRSFERVALDILGPLPETPGKNSYIPVVGDYFLNWAEAPHKVLHGRNVVLPVDVMLNLDTQEHFSSVNDYVSRLFETLSTIIDPVEDIIIKILRIIQCYSNGELV